jgi:hypothetical protein
MIIFKKEYLLLFGIYIILISIALLQPGLKIDEWYNHLPMVQKMYEIGFFNMAVSDNYSAANPPLPYLFTFIPHKIIGIPPSIITARIITALFSFLTLIIAYKIFLLLQSDYPLIKTLIILFYPYFLKPSFTFYMAVYGLLFFLAAYYILQKDKKNPFLVLTAGICAAAAILSQQFYLIILVPFMIYLIYERDDLHKIKNIFTRRNILMVSLFFLPVLLFTLPIFFLWGGLTHPNYSFHRISPDITNLTSILISFGGFLLPVSLINYRYLKSKIHLVFIAAAVVLVVFFYPEWSIKAGDGEITGMSFNFIEIVGGVSFLLGLILKVSLVFSGIFIIYLTAMLLKMNVKIFLLGITIMIMCAGFVFNEFLAERHLLPLIVTLYIVHLSYINRKSILYLWLGMQGTIGIIYFYYYLFIQQSF